MQGFYKMYRDWWDHPVFKQDPKRMMAWEWLIAKALFKPKMLYFKGGRYQLQAGQLVISVRDLKRYWQAWGFSERSVRTFLKELTKDTLIDTEATTHGTVITLYPDRVMLFAEIQDGAVFSPSSQEAKIGDEQAIYQALCETDETQKRHTESTQYKKGKNINKGNKLKLLLTRERKKQKNNCENTQQDMPQDESRAVADEKTALPDAVPPDKLQQITDLLRAHNPRDMGRVHVWVEQGYDMDVDIVPTIKRLVETHKGRIHTLRYFDQAIANAKASRETAMPQGTLQKERPQIGMEEAEFRQLYAQALAKVNDINQWEKECETQLDTRFALLSNGAFKPELLSAEMRSAS